MTSITTSSSRRVAKPLRTGLSEHAILFAGGASSAFQSLNNALVLGASEPAYHGRIQSLVMLGFMRGMMYKNHRLNAGILVCAVLLGGCADQIADPGTGTPATRAEINVAPSPFLVETPRGLL